MAETKKTTKEKIKKPTKKAAKATVEVAKPMSKDAFDVIQFVLMTEKSVRSVEAQNKLVFIVRRNSTRDEVKQSVEKIFEAPVSGVKTAIDQKGRKKAFVRFKNAGAAGDIAIKLGII